LALHEEQVIVLSVAIATINAWNQLAAGSEERRGRPCRLTTPGYDDKLGHITNIPGATCDLAWREVDLLLSRKRRRS
jgi:hypothetical protein